VEFTPAGLVCRLETNHEWRALPILRAKRRFNVRSFLNSVMNKFRQLGFVEYNGEMKVHSSLLSIVLAD
jgi:hypothetical protein